MSRSNLVAIVVFLCIWGTSITSVSARTEKERESLRGLQGVGLVLVEELPSNLEKYGLTTGQLQSDLELRLRKAGIPVSSGKDFESAVNHLYVRITTHQDREINAVAIEITFKEPAKLMRNPSALAFATTWESNSVGVVGLSNVKSLREGVFQHVDEFIKDYLSVNPQKRSGLTKWRTMTTVASTPPI